MRLAITKFYHVCSISLKSRKRFCLHVAHACASLLFAMILFGFSSYNCIYFPTFNAALDDGISITEALLALPEFCLVTEGRNQNRLVGWRMERQRDKDIACRPESPFLALVGIDQNGHPSSSDSPALERIDHGGALFKSFDNTALYRLERLKTATWTLPKTDSRDQEISFVLSGDELLFNATLAVNAACSYSPNSLRPFFKNKEGHVFYDLTPPPGFQGNVLSLSLDADVVGPKSFIAARLRRKEEDCGVTMALRETGAEAAIIGGKNAMTPECAREKGMTTCVFRFPNTFNKRGETLRLDITLSDDGSGAIYSSEAYLRKIEVRIGGKPVETIE